MPEAIDLIIPNMAEYFLRNPALNLTGDQRNRVVTFSGTYECDHSVFWSHNKRVLLLPEGLDPLWFDDIHRVLGLRPPPVVSPLRHSGLIVQDLLRDGAAQAALREHLSGHSLVRMVNYGPTPDTYLLASILRGWGLNVELDEVTEDHYWTSLYLDSKVSCLDLSRQLPRIRVASGFTVSNWHELRGAVDVMLARHGRVIARSLYGVAGDGTAVVTTDPDSLARFFERVADDSFFPFPLLVQEFIEHAPRVGCPAVDILIDDDGVQEIVFCALTVEEGHLFRSVNVGQDALPAVWAERITQAARDLGSAARDLGYRGWMCVDCVAGADDELYVTEINARRSGSTHAGSLIHLWKAEQELTLSAHFMVPLPPGTTYREHIRPVFQRFWENGVHAYPTTIRATGWPDPIMAVITAAPTAREAEQIVTEIEKALNPSSGPNGDAALLAAPQEQAHPVGSR